MKNVLYSTFFIPSICGIRKSTDRIGEYDIRLADSHTVLIEEESYVICSVIP